MKKKNTITLKTAKKWAKRWRKKESNYNSYNKLNAFNIPKIDLIEVLQEDGVASIRAYLGVEKFVNKDTGEKIYQEKLMIVGVDVHGKDMLSVDRSGKALIAGNGSEIYDFTNPCPDSCDTESPLN
ncbi:hypothetical protein [Polaribacter sp.]|uniref:hypothetical protein n=1 Tax=Polaribacter sp. TaxID=1920175 RepID=UPI003EF1F191